MAKLSENQAAALAALRSLISTSGVAHADKGAWRRHAPDGVKINAPSLVKAGAIVAQRAAVGSRIVEVYAPARAETEVGG